MRDTKEELSLLNRLAQELTSCLELDRFVPRALEGVTRVMASDLALLYLKEGNQMRLEGRFPSSDPFEEVGGEVEKVGHCLCGLAGAGDAVYSSDIHSDPRCVLTACKNAGITSFAALPLKARGSVIGVLALASVSGLDFGRQHVFLETVASQLAVALQNSLLYETMAGQVEALKLSQERYQIVSGLTSDYAYAYRVQPDGELVNEWVTGAFKRISGYTREEIKARGGWESLIFPDDTPIAMKQLKSLLNNEAAEVEYRILSKTGEIRWMRDYARPVMDDTRQKLMYIYGAVQDISERKAAEAALQASEEKYRELVENINDTLFLADKDGRLLYISPAIAKISGYQPTELVGQMVQAYICPEDAMRVKRHFEQLRRGVIVPTECRLVTKSGRTKWVRVSSNPVLKDRKITQIQGVLTDIDRAKKVAAENARLQEQLQQSQKMEAIGTLAGGIAHDFNNILSAIIGYTEMAMAEAEEGTPLHQSLMEIFRASDRAKDLVKQILTFSRQSKQETQPVQMKLIAKEVIKFMRASLPATISIRQKIGSDALIMADPTQVYQIILNLCTNAGYAMAEVGGLLEVTLADVEVEADSPPPHPNLIPGHYIQLVVRDTGHGIPEPILKRIFDPFFTTKEKDRGTGMGLSVVHGIVGSYGGCISVDSEPGKGSTFTVYLPSARQAVEWQPDTREPIATGTEHILLVDDEEALAKIGSKTLKSLGYKVTARTSSLEALDLFKAGKETFDLVITDATMPNLSGDQLAREMIRIKPQIPIILYSGHSSSIDQRQAAALGIRAFVTKPILRNEIARIIRKVLDEDPKAPRRD
jgi:PAS domain S-box-containing protein